MACAPWYFGRMTTLRTLAAFALLPLAACATPPAETDAALVDASAPADAGEGDAGDDAGRRRDAGGDAGPSPVEVFADVGSTTEGIALGATPDGTPVLYVGAADDRIVRVDAAGVVSDFVSIDGPVGLSVRRDGTLLVCAKLPAAMGGAPAIFTVTPDGVVTPIVTAAPGGAPFGLTNFVTEAPDGSIVFSDSAGDALYRADADGSHVALVAAISYANGLAFSPDGTTLYVASWDTQTLHAIAFDPATGTYGARTTAHEGVSGVDGLVTTSTGAIVLVTSTLGILLVDPTAPTAEPTTLLAGRALALPANGVFGDAAFGIHDVFLSSLGRQTIFVLHTDLAGP